MTRLAILLALSLSPLLDSCGSPPQPNPQPLPPPASGGSASGGQGGSAGESGSLGLCEHLQSVGCPEVRDVATCAGQIDQIQALGSVASIDTKCLWSATTVEAVRACKSLPCGGVL